MAAMLLLTTACAREQQANLVLSPTTPEAHRLCRIADRSGITTKPCNVSGGRYIDLTVGVQDARLASVYCHELRMAAVEHEIAFDRTWSMRFYSAYSANGPIASCSVG